MHFYAKLQISFQHYSISLPLLCPWKKKLTTTKRSKSNLESPQQEQMWLNFEFQFLLYTMMKANKIIVEFSSLLFLILFIIFERRNWKTPNNCSTLYLIIIWCFWTSPELEFFKNSDRNSVPILSEKQLNWCTILQELRLEFCRKSSWI